MSFYFCLYKEAILCLLDQTALEPVDLHKIMNFSYDFSTSVCKTYLLAKIEHWSAIDNVKNMHLNSNIKEIIHTGST